ncbi:MAG: hypothetical protein IT306_17290 [Chloroflexi bacterium]|nr:hypothetical protein [Chloroflexota bacterium]
MLATLAPLLIGFTAYDVYSQRASQEQVLLEKGRIIAQTQARVAAEVFSQALASGALTQEQLFDTKYSVIPNTEPKKYHTGYDAYVDTTFQKIEDEVLRDEDVVFAVLVDRNGYLPTHNTKYAVGAATPALNRTKRLFDDPVGLAAAQNVDPFLQQVYKRDTGETMWDLSAPIVVNGQHWGAFRVGFSIQRVEARLADLTQRIVLTMLAMLLFVAVVTVLIASWIARSVGRVAGLASVVARHDLPNLMEAVERAAAGDLRGRVEIQAQPVTVSSDDELGRMSTDVNTMVSSLQETGEAFTQMTGSLRQMLGQVRVAADSVAETSQELGAVTGETANAVAQVAEAIGHVAVGAQDSANSVQGAVAAISEVGRSVDEIARGTSTQAGQITEVTATVAQMASGVELVATNVRRVSSASAQTRSSAEDGSRAVRETIDGMADIRTVVAQAAERVEALGALGSKIGAVVETIDDIAEQTNLLALNAAIEAARAGEHGKGFAVVADEVRKLAERSQRETRGISELIREVQTGTSAAVDAMRSSSVKVDLGAERADQAGSALAEILAAIDETVAQVATIATAADQLTGGAQSVVQTMQSISGVVDESSAATDSIAGQTTRVTQSFATIAAVSEENSAATDEVSASCDSIRAQVDGISAQADELAATADQLKTLIGQFELDEGPGNRGRGEPSRAHAWAPAGRQERLRPAV